MKKKILTSLLAVALIITIAPFKAEAKKGLELWVDGIYVDSDSDPYIEDGRTLVPVRFIAEELGYNVDWQNATKTITINDGENTITLQIGNQTAKHNGKAIKLNKEPKLSNGRTFVPVRDIAETFGKYVDWDEDNFTVVIGKGYQGSVQGGRRSISEEEAKEIALNFANGGRIVDFESDDDEYEIDIIKDGYKYEFEISRKNGDIIEIKVEYKYDDVRANGRNPIGKDQAVRIAQGIAPGKIVEYEFDDGKYEFKIVGNGYKYEIEINAYDGSLLEYERDKDDDDDDRDDKNPQRKIISEAKAREIALDRVGNKNAKIVKFELDDDDDDAEYKIEIIADGKEYEIEIDAYTGKVLEFEVDDIDD